jgi:hypothetical protein
MIGLFHGQTPDHLRAQGVGAQFLNGTAEVFVKEMSFHGSWAPTVRRHMTIGTATR